MNTPTTAVVVFICLQMFTIYFYFLTSTLSEKCDPGLVATEVTDVVLNPSEMFKFVWWVFFSSSPPPFYVPALTRFKSIFLTYLFSCKVWELAGGLYLAVHRDRATRFSSSGFSQEPA